MTLQERHGEPPQPTQVVAQGPIASAALIFAEVHVQDPVHRLDAPVATDRFAESLAAEIAAAEIVTYLVRLRAVGIPRDSHGIADRLDPRPVLRCREVTRHPGQEIGSFVDATVPI